tara:strand:+ start:188 stop:484 length:297 start_codon:yes stop_codon:yes gene_type:complete
MIQLSIKQLIIGLSAIVILTLVLERQIAGLAFSYRESTCGIPENPDYRKFFEIIDRNVSPRIQEMHRSNVKFYNTNPRFFTDEVGYAMDCIKYSVNEQ